MPEQPIAHRMMRNGGGRVNLLVVIREFWADVQTRLQRYHKLSLPQARDAVRTYRRRVGNVALNQGKAETAADIASAVRGGGFAPISRPRQTRATVEA